MKVKIVAIITVVILLVTYIPVYADTPIPDPPSDVWEYWVICDGGYYYDFMCISSHNPITVSRNEKDIIFDTLKYYLYENNEWVLYISDIDDGSVSFGTMYQANHDIAYYDGSGFFFLRPRVSLLYPTMERTDFGTILRTFSVGLIPIVGLIVLALSLRKAWAFLRGQLTT